MTNKLILGVSVLLLGGNILLSSTEKENIQPTEVSAETIVETEQTNENTIHSLEGMEFETQDSVYELNDYDDKDEYLKYLPLKALKYAYGNIEYYYLSDSMGTLYIHTENDLIEGQNYIAEIGRYTDNVYELQESDFEFEQEYLEAFDEWLQEDRETVTEIFIEEMGIEAK